MDEPIEQTKHLFHNILRDATANGGYAVRTMGKEKRHKKTGKLLVDVVGFGSGVEQVIWCENEDIAAMWQAVPQGSSVNIKAFGNREKAYMQLFDVNGNEVTPETRVAPGQGGFAGAGTGGGFAVAAPSAPDPNAFAGGMHTSAPPVGMQPLVFPGDAPAPPPPDLMAPAQPSRAQIDAAVAALEAQDAARAASLSAAQVPQSSSDRMLSCFAEAIAVITEVRRHLPAPAPDPLFEDYRTLAISFFIERNRR